MGGIMVKGKVKNNLMEPNGSKDSTNILQVG